MCIYAKSQNISIKFILIKIKKKYFFHLTEKYLRWIQIFCRWGQLCILMSSINKPSKRVLVCIFFLIITKNLKLIAKSKKKTDSSFAPCWLYDNIKTFISSKQYSHFQIYCEKKNTVINRRKCIKTIKNAKWLAFFCRKYWVRNLIFVYDTHLVMLKSFNYYTHIRIWIVFFCI